MWLVCIFMSVHLTSVGFLVRPYFWSKVLLPFPGKYCFWLECVSSSFSLIVHSVFGQCLAVTCSAGSLWALSWPAWYYCARLFCEKTTVCACGVFDFDAHNHFCSPELCCWSIDLLTGSCWHWRRMWWVMHRKCGTPTIVSLQAPRAVCCQSKLLKPALCSQPFPPKALVD